MGDVAGLDHSDDLVQVLARRLHAGRADSLRGSRASGDKNDASYCDGRSP